jgi:hypothetical protein
MMPLGAPFLRTGDGWMHFDARRGIRGREQRTSGYGRTHHHGEGPCRCGSPLCESPQCQCFLETA